MSYGQRIKPSSVASVKRRPSLLDKAKSILFSRRNSVSGATSFGSQHLDGGSQMRRNADGSDDEEVGFLNGFDFWTANLKFRAPLLSLSTLTFSKKEKLFTVRPSCMRDTSRIARANYTRQLMALVLFWFQTDFKKWENFQKNLYFLKFGKFGILAFSKDWSGLSVLSSCLRVSSVKGNFLKCFIVKNLSVLRTYLSECFLELGKRVSIFNRIGMERLSRSK